MLKTDPISLSESDQVILSKEANIFMDTTRTTLTIFGVAVVIILFFIVGPLRPASSFYTLCLRILACLILVYAIYMNTNSLMSMYNIKGLFSLNSMHDVRLNFYMCIFFTILMGSLAVILLYKHFF